MMRRTVVTLAAALLLLGARPASAQQEFPQTLYWGTGLVDIPVAWVSPLSGDFTLNYMAKRFREDPGQTKLNTSDRFNSQLAFSVALFGRVETGVAFFSRNPEYGFFGRVLLLREEDLETKGGLVRWLPSVAIGARNLGRFGRRTASASATCCFLRRKGTPTRGTSPTRCTRTSAPRAPSTAWRRRPSRSTRCARRGPTST